MKNTIKKITSQYLGVTLYIISFIICVIAMAFGWGDVLIFAFAAMLFVAREALYELDAMDE